MCFCSGDQSKRKGLSVSKAEKERQQILEEMKKRTQLLTDNSWIRQRSSFYKDPMIVGLPLKRWDLSQAAFKIGLIAQWPVFQSVCFQLFFYYCDFLPADMTLWIILIICVSPNPQSIVTLDHTRPLQVTLHRVGMPLRDTALDQYYPWEILTYSPVIRPGTHLCKLQAFICCTCT